MHKGPTATPQFAEASLPLYDQHSEQEQLQLVIMDLKCAAAQS